MTAFTNFSTGRRTTAALSAFVAVLAVLVFGATPSQAASGDSGYIKVTSSLRSCQDTRCPVNGSAPAGAWTPTYCWRDGNSYGGTPRWFRIRYGGVTGWVSGSQMSPQPSVPYCDSLEKDERIYQGEAVYSSNGAYHLVMQTDGNLVTYGPYGAIWATMTSNGYFAVMQGDGNFVVYNSAGGAVWNSGTGWPGTRLAMQSDSNLVEYTGSTALWASSWHMYQGQATRTWNAGASGNCTWYAMERFKGFWARHQYPAISGNAGDWDNSARALGYNVQGTPTTQAVVVYEAYLTPGYPGHVAWVDGMQPRTDGTYIHIVEMNHLGLGAVDDRWVKVVGGMSFITTPAM